MHTNLQKVMKTTTSLLLAFALWRRLMRAPIEIHGVATVARRASRRRLPVHLQDTAFLEEQPVREQGVGVLFQRRCVHVFVVPLDARGEERDGWFQSALRGGQIGRRFGQSLRTNVPKVVTLQASTQQRTPPQTPENESPRYYCSTSAD